MSKFKKYFKDTTDSILADYNTSKSLNHSGIKGGVREFFIKKFLKSCSPPKFFIGTGEIIDSNENTSPQADIIIYDESMPKLNYGDIDQFFAEGVLAHLEVKTFLGKEKLQEALMICSEVQKLSYNLDFSFSLGEVRNNIPSFIVAYEGPTKETFKKNILEFIKLNPKIKLPEGIFVLSQGYAFIVDGDEFNFVDTNDETLAFLFIKLNHAMFKNWSGHPNLGLYVKELSYQGF